MSRSAQNYETPLDQVNQQQFLIRQLLVDVHTALPCRVRECYPLPPGDARANDDGIMGLVDVDLMIDQIDNDEKRVETKPIYNVPYGRLQGGNCAIVIDPVKGDRGWLSFGERDISKFKKTREKSLPGSNRMLSQSDGAYYPAIMNDPPEIYIQLHPEKGIIVNCGGKPFKLENCSGMTINAKSQTNNIDNGIANNTPQVSNSGVVNVSKDCNVGGNVNCAGTVNCAAVNTGGGAGGGGCSMGADGSMGCSSMDCSGNASCGSMDCQGDMNCGGNSTCAGSSTCGGTSTCGGSVCNGDSSVGGNMSCGGGISCGGAAVSPGIFTAAKDFVIEGLGKLSDLLGGSGEPEGGGDEDASS